MKSDSDSFTMEEGAIESKVELNPEQHLEAGIRPVPNPSVVLETTSNQNVKEESSNNPWDVYSIFDFNYFCCPECDFKLKSDFEASAKQDFVNHAISNHPLAVNFLQQISDGSLDDLALPFYGFNSTTKIKEEPLELPESEFDGYCNNFVKTEIVQMIPGVKRKLKRNSKKKKKEKGKVDEYLETKEIKKEQSGKGDESISMPKEELKCNICGKVYNRAGRLKTHIEFVHEGKKSFVCDRCPRKFISKDSLEYHVAFEHELKELGIDDTNLSEHCDNPKVKELLRKSHNKVQILKKQLCKLCGKEVHGRNTHIREKHSDGNGNYKCPKCDLTFRQYFLAYSHVMSIHEKDPCSVCGEMVGTRNMIKHMQTIHKINPPEKKFKCEYCQKSFRGKNNLQDHLNTHTGARPHLCKFCGKGFAHSGTYSRHIRSCALSMRGYI